MTWTPDRIKLLRTRLGLNQIDFAKTLGTRQATISQWEKGRIEPSPMAEKLLTLIEDTAMSQPNEYAGSLYRTRHEATMASIDDWLTANGMNSAQDTLKDLSERREQIVTELTESVQKNEWHLPGYDNPTREEVDALIREWEEVNS